MIKLKNIKISGHLIKCDIFPEDSKENGYIEIDAKTKRIIDYSLPKGYEWCKAHINHAKDYLIEEKTYIPNEKIIMWC